MLLAISADDLLRGSVMIGHVERCEAGSDIGFHCRRRDRGIEHLPVSLHVGDLPQSREDSGDGEPVAKFAALDPYVHVMLAFPGNDGLVRLARFLRLGNKI